MGGNAVKNCRPFCILELQQNGDDVKLFEFIDFISRNISFEYDAVGSFARAYLRHDYLCHPLNDIDVIINIEDSTLFTLEHVKRKLVEQQVIPLEERDVKINKGFRMVSFPFPLQSLTNIQIDLIFVNDWGFSKYWFSQYGKKENLIFSELIKHFFPSEIKYEKDGYTEKKYYINPLDGFVEGKRFFKKIGKDKYVKKGYYIDKKHCYDLSFIDEILPQYNFKIYPDIISHCIIPDQIDLDNLSWTGNGEYINHPNYNQFQKRVEDIKKE